MKNTETAGQTATDSPKIFLTDYVSYNNGKQFEFGHWADLTQFADADDFLQYIKNHFEEADKKSPLGFGCKREEPMFTDFENFPRCLYSESMGAKDLENLFEFINLDDDDKMKVCFILEQGESFDYAISKYEDVYFIEDTDAAIYDEFEMFYPDAEKARKYCPYIDIDYEQFRKENYTEFEYNGEYYLVSDSWNN